MSAAFAAPVTSTHVWDSTRNEYISSDHLRFAQLLNEYDPKFSLEYVPANERLSAAVEEQAKPFRIVERTAAHGRQVVRYLSEADMNRPEEVLAWVWEGDLAKHRATDVLDKIALKERAERMLKLAKQRDEAEERQEMVAYAVAGGRHNKSVVRMGNGIKIER